MIFAAAVGVALLIALLNLAGLMLSRGLARRGELAVRSALGAGTVRIAWSLMAEGVVLAVVGAVLGAALAAGLLPTLVSAAPQNWAGALLQGAGVDGRALVFTVTLPSRRSCGAGSRKGCARALDRSAGAGRFGSVGAWYSLRPHWQSASWLWPAFWDAPC